MMSLSAPSSYSLPKAGVNVTLPASVPYKQITTGTWDNRYPVWSPNGSSIAYISDKEGLWSVWVMTASGASPEQVSTPGPLAMFPTWSPDSSKLSYWFMDGLESGYEVVDLGSLTASRVTPDNITALQGPAQWSPDGTMLAFFVNPGKPQLAVSNVSSGEMETVANASGSLVSASWSSNDQLYYSTSVNGWYSIMSVNLLTGASGVVVGGGSDFVDPVAGPNGTLAYFSDYQPPVVAQLMLGGGGYNIWFAGADGSNATYQSQMSVVSEAQPNVMVPVPYVPGLTDLSSIPVWSPDGTKVAYVATSSLFSSTFVWNTVAASTASLGPVQAGVNVVDPSWSPDSVNLAFSCNMTGTYQIWVGNTAGVGESQVNIGPGY